MAATRRLAAIMFTDMVGFTALAQTDEASALQLLREEEDLVRPLFTAHQGREIKSTGDGFLVEFDSALNAVRCGIDIHQHLKERNGQKGARPIQLRIGVHLGDVEEREGDIFGDAVNIASRILPLAPPGGLCISGPVFDQVRNKIPNHLEKLEPRQLKSLRFPLEVYGVALGWTVRESPSGTTEPSRLAVLPFVNISPDPNDEFFADGLTEEMIARLSLLKGLEVIARTSVMTYKGKGKSATQIGKELGAGTLLEGSVRKAGNRIRVTVQLIDSNTEGHLWAENYEGNLENIFSVQSEIAEKVASSLKLQLLEEDKKRIEREGTQNVEAYTLLLKGRFHIHGWEEASLREAIHYFEEAVAADPNYAAAYAALANANASLGFLDMVDPKEAYPKAEAYARKALELDESLPEAHLALAYATENKYDMAGEQREIERALELNPNSVGARIDLARVFMFRGKTEDSLREIEKALALDPLSILTAEQAGIFYHNARQFDRAIGHLKDALELDPKNSHALGVLGVVHVQMGKVEEGLEELTSAAKASGSANAWSTEIACALVKAGKPEKAREILAKLLGSAEQGRAHSLEIAGVYAILGAREKAFEWLDRAFEDRTGFLVAVGVDEAFESLHDDPRFQALLKKLNLA